MSNAEPQNTTSTTREIQLEVGGHNYTFTVSREAFNRFLRESQRDANQAAHNCLLRTVADKERDRLRAAFDANWSLPLQMMAHVQDEIGGEEEVVVKKR